MKQSPIRHNLSRGFTLLFVAALLALPLGIMPVHTAFAAGPTPVLDQSFTTPTNASSADQRML